MAACGDDGGGARTPSTEEEAAIQSALSEARSEAVLTGDVYRTSAQFLVWRDAVPVLEQWGVGLPEWPSPPPGDVQVWVVTIVADGVEPAPPNNEHTEQCLELLVVISEDEQLNGLLSGKDSDGCP